MSLIGPRPEARTRDRAREAHSPLPQTTLDATRIKRLGPVCAPYASSIEDSDLKLSYDLYYLRNFSAWLDLMIMLRTVKTVLKAGGR